MFVLMFRKIFLVVFISSILTGCFSVKNTNNFSYEKLTVDQYQEMLSDSSNYTIIDVRTKKEYKKGHFENSINLSFLSLRYGAMVDSLQKDKLVFVYCQTCHRSPLAARRMKRMGFRKIYDLKGGYSKLKKSNY